MTSNRPLVSPSVAARAVAAGLAALVLAACAGATPGVPGPAGLAYGIPDPNPATYILADTATFIIEAGPMGTLDVRVAQEATAELAFRRRGDGYDVDVSVPRYRGSFENPSQGSNRADQSHIGGPVGVSLDARGRVEVVDTPRFDPAILDITGPESLVRPLFVHLPGRPVDVGDRWVDTVRTLEETPESTSRGHTVITSTLAGDTMVAGERMLVIVTSSENLIEMEGRSGGVDIRQRLTGGTAGRIVWDPERHLLVERNDNGELSGTLELPGMGVGGLPVRGSVARRVRLRD